MGSPRWRLAPPGLTILSELAGAWVVFEGPSDTRLLDQILRPPGTRAFVPTRAPPPPSSSNRPSRAESAALAEPRCPGRPGSWALLDPGELGRGPVSPEGGGPKAGATCTDHTTVTGMSPRARRPRAGPPAGLCTLYSPPRRLCLECWCRRQLPVRATSPECLSSSRVLYFTTCFISPPALLKEMRPMFYSQSIGLLFNDLVTCLLSGSSRKKD